MDERPIPVEAGGPDAEPAAAPSPQELEVRAPAAELEDAIAAFDARERARTPMTRAPREPVSLNEVDRRVWIGVAAVPIVIALLLGGAPWHRGYWIALAAVLLVMSPVVGTAILLWRRNG